MKPSFPRLSLSTIALVLVPLVLLALICLLVYPNDLKLQNTVATANCGGLSPAANFLDPVSRQPDFRLLIGILTVPDHYERRHLIRLAYSLQPPVTSASIDIRFVFCNLTKEEQRVLVALEILRYDDIIILDCAEGMDNGKTYAYFSSVPKMFNAADGTTRPPYDYVMKADDDLFIRLQNLADSLGDLPREDMYFGRMIQCFDNDPFKGYMSGMGYVLSWDLVEWIATSETARNHTQGPEDSVTAGWLKEGGRAKNRFNAKPGMYNFPEELRNPCMHDLMPETIAVHKLKDNWRWARTLEYFNVTNGLKPSKLYHIP